MRERTTTTQQQQKKKRGLLLLFCMSRRRLAAQGKLGCFQTHLCVYVFVFPTATSRLSSICCFSEGKEPAGQNCDDKKTLYSSHWRRKTERLHIYICICTYREREVFFFSDVVVGTPCVNISNSVTSPPRRSRHIVSLKKRKKEKKNTLHLYPIELFFFFLC